MKNINLFKKSLHPNLKNFLGGMGVVVGVDIGFSTLKIVEIKRSKGELTLNNYIFAVIPHAARNDEAQRREFIVKTLKEAKKEGKLTAHLKEQVRRTLAQSSGCAYCKAKGKPEPNLYDEKISIAVGFAEVFIKQKGDVPDAIFKVLKEYMSDGEISELCAFITFATASQYFGAIMKLEAQATDI